VDTLKSVQVIAAEDTRIVGRLLAAYEIATPTLSYHDYNELSRARTLLARLLSGESVALVSDAGTPLINDPGFRIVQACINAGVMVVSLPGPCAAITALAGSGLPPDKFLFVGFPPRTGVKRRAFYRELRDVAVTIVLYEAPHRLVASLADIAQELGDRRVCLARSLTKPHETYVRGTIVTIVAQLKHEHRVLGETTIVLSGQSERSQVSTTSGPPEGLLQSLMDEGLQGRALLKRLRAETGLSRREAYALILSAKLNGGVATQAATEF
jgi:16S rRNA (cytidine1402-2'-O)-methyltransferase